MDHMNGPITIKNIALRVKTSAGPFWTQSSEPAGGEGSHYAPGWLLLSSKRVDSCATMGRCKDEHVCNAGDLVIGSGPVIKSLENDHSLIIQVAPRWPGPYGNVVLGHPHMSRIASI